VKWSNVAAQWRAAPGVRLQTEGTTARPLQQPS